MKVCRSHQPSVDVDPPLLNSISILSALIPASSFTPPAVSIFSNAPFTVAVVLLSIFKALSGLLL